MKLSFVIFSALASGMLAASSHAVVVLAESFPYAPTTAVPLVGQGSPAWAQLGATSTNPVQVNVGNFVSLANTGQDVQKPLDAVVPHTDGQAITTEFDFTISAVGTGDYFAHLTSSSGTSPFYNRFYIRTTTPTGGFQLGLSAGNPVAAPVYGADLSFGQSYHVVSTWTFQPGALNDEFSATIGGTPYIAPFVWNTASPEPTDVALFNLRQGGGAAAPTVSALDNVLVNSVPEPSALSIGALASLFALRRRRGV